ncbi:MAG: YdaU family protein [Cellvibrionaceae bacterium]
MHFYPHNIPDFNNATRHLTRVERSVYRDAIELYYDTESVLTGDLEKLERRLLCVSEEEKSALKVVLDDFFELTDDGYSHERCDEEIAKYRANIGAKAKAGIASAEARKRKAAERKQNSTGVKSRSTPVHNQELITNNQELITTGKSAIQFSEIKNLFNKILEDKLKPVRDVGPERQKHIRARVGEDSKRQSLDWWEKYFEVVAGTGFLIGLGSPDPRTGKPWKCDFDWLINRTNMTKVLEGKYENE